jgi:hypothetical protein
MINNLINLANALDESGFKKEADRVDALIRKNGANCGSIKSRHDRLFGAFKDKLQEAVGEGCIKNRNIHEYVPGEKYSDKAVGCKKLIDEVEQAYVDYSDSVKSYTSKCGPTSPSTSGSNCESQIAAYNEAYKAHNALVDKYEKECYDKDDDNDYWTNENLNKCKSLQKDICEADHRAREALMGAREACGCNRDGAITCRWFRDGGRFRLPGVSKKPSHCQ